MNPLFDVPEFNLKDEADDQCQLCKREFPNELHFIEPTFIGDRYKDLCPACARGVLNLLLKRPRWCMFASEAANENYYRFMSYLAQQEGGKE